MNYLQMLINPLKDRSNQPLVPKQQSKKQENKQTHDPQQVVLYQQNIFLPLQQQQVIDSLDPHYIDEQIDLNGEIRATMVNELHRMCIQYKAQRATYHQSVFLLDAYLSKKKFIAAQINIILKACYFIASKYEEIHPTPVWYYATDKYEKESIIKCEHELLFVLDFRLIIATSYVWLNYYWTILKVPEKNNNWLNYSHLLIDIATYSQNLVSYEPSKIACAALYSSAQLQNIVLDWNFLAQQFDLHFTHEFKQAANLISLTLKNCVAKKYEIVNHISLEQQAQFI